MVWLRNSAPPLACLTVRDARVYDARRVLAGTRDDCVLISGFAHKSECRPPAATGNDGDVMAQPFIKLDVNDRQLREWAEQLSRDTLRKAMRNSIDRAGRETFRATADDIERESGVSKSKWGGSIGRMKRPTQFDLSARVSYSKKKVSILNVVGVKVTGRGVIGSGWLLSAGGAIKFGGAFVVGAKSKGKATGGKFVLRRTGASRYPVKAIVAASPAAVMGNTRGVVVKNFERKANEALHRHLTADVQKALLGRGTSA